MSLYIDAEKVTAVLLADGWHAVVSGTFYIDAYEFHEESLVILAGGRAEGVSATGFGFHEGKGAALTTIYGPITSVLAVRATPPR